MYIKLNPEIKKRWLKALRSGEIQQTTGQLRNGDAMCCLGVLCNLHAEDHPEIAAKEKSKTTYMGDKAYPAPAVYKWAFNGWYDKASIGLFTGGDTTLVHYNDRGESFSFIADKIEAFF